MRQSQGNNVGWELSLSMKIWLDNESWKLVMISYYVSVADFSILEFPI